MQQNAFLSGEKYLIAGVNTRVKHNGTKPYD